MKLREYIDSEGIKLHVFAKKIGVSLKTLHSILEGYDTRLSVGIRIHTVTKGKVKVQELLPTKQRPSTMKEKTASP